MKSCHELKKSLNVRMFIELCHSSMSMWNLEFVMIANESDGDGDETVKRMLMKGMRQFPY